MDSLNDRGKFFTFIVYPEHLKTDNHVQYISDCLDGYSIAVSPLHDKDKLADGSLKKAHYHINIMFNGKVTYNSVVRLLIDSFGGDEVGNFSKPNFVSKFRSAQNVCDRYLVHFDQPSKYPYYKDSSADLNYGVSVFNGYPLKLVDNEDKMRIILNDYLYNDSYKNIKSLRGLIMVLMHEDRYDLIEYVQSHTYFINNLINF